MSKVIKKTFPDFKVEVLSVGKRKKDPLANEDGWVVTEDKYSDDRTILIVN